MLAVLGLTDTADGDWSRVRALQQNAVSSFTRARLLANIIGVIIILQNFWQKIEHFYLAGWIATVAAALFFSTRTYEQTGSNPYDKSSRQRINDVALGALAIGTVWCIPMLFFASPASLTDYIVTWSVMVALMGASALLMSAVPLGTIIFVTMLTLVSVYTFQLSGNPVMVGASIFYGLMLVMASLHNAKSYLMFKISEEGSDEKGEVVSLLLREFEESSADWLWQVNSQRKVVHISPRFAHALGREASDIEGMSFVELIAGDTWETGNIPSSVRDFAEKLKRRESFSNFLVRVEINGHRYWWELSASPKLDENGVFLGFWGVGSDVTEQRESAEKISQLARFDTLTSLPNRLLITETMAKSMQNAEKWNGRCAFMMIDLDRFKSVNDTLGHLVGDRLLAHVSQRLKSIMSENELCGRLGGDEFAVVIKDASEAGYVARIANKIIESLSRPYLVDQHKLYIGASIGSAIGPRDGRTVEMLMRNADLALYRSKDGGGGQHRAYEPRLHVHAEERRVMEIALRSALEKEEFSLLYQPVVSADTEGVQCFEALLRWSNEEFGNVSPAKFVPLAEEARLIGDIGEWVMREACKEAMNWPSNIKVAVNISAEQLSNPKFMPSLVDALRESGLPAQRLEIEVTESIFLHEGTGATDVLEEILAMGIGLSLDDFGTGYSSLGYLRKTRFSTIKVDRSFVKGAAKNAAESLAIIRAVVAMADSLGMATTAEGAETREEVEMIKSLGCKKIQGYFYGRPMAAADARKLFAFPELDAGTASLSADFVKRSS